MDFEYVKNLIGRYPLSKTDTEGVKMRENLLFLCDDDIAVKRATTAYFEAWAKDENAKRNLIQAIENSQEIPNTYKTHSVSLVSNVVDAASKVKLPVTVNILKKAYYNYLEKEKPTGALNREIIMNVFLELTEKDLKLRDVLFACVKECIAYQKAESHFLTVTDSMAISTSGVLDGLNGNKKLEDELVAKISSELRSQKGTHK